jgi:UDP-glucose 4-epimerase
MKNKNILVTGHKGFIGAHLCNELSRRGANVIGIDKEDGGITNVSLLPGIMLFPQSIDYIFHLGAISSVPACTESPFEAHDVNVTGTFNVLSAAVKYKVKGLVFASSSVVHDPKSMYAVTKVIGEAYCKFFDYTQSLPVTALRLYNVYGPGQSSDTAVIPNFIRSIKEHKKLQIEGKGNQIRDFVYVKDVVNAMIYAAENGINGCHDIGTGIGTDINSLATLIGSIMDKLPVRIKYIGARIGDISTSIADKATWFEPEYSLINGLKETIEDWK